MTVSPAVASALDDLRARLAQNLSDGALDLTDDLLGRPLLAPLLHTSALTLTGAALDLSQPDAVALSGVADVLGFSGVHLDLRLSYADDTLSVTLELSSSTPFRIVDGLAVTVKDLLCRHDGAGDWTVSGAITADLFGAAIDLSAALTGTPEARRFTFTAQATLAADLAGAGTLSGAGLSLSVGRSTAGEYSWSIEADGSLDLLDRAIVIDGALGLEGEGDTAALTLSPSENQDAAQVVVALPEAPSVGVHLGFNRLRLYGGAGAFSADATASVWFSGLPGQVATVLPGSRDTSVTGAFTVRTGADAGVTFSVEPLLPRQPIDLRQERSAVEVGRLEIAWARAGGLSVGADFGVGLPPSLNQIFGGHDVLVTYDDAQPDSLVRLKLAAALADGGPSLRLHPLTSPIRKLVFEPATDGSDDRTATVDLGDFGTFSLLVPTLEVQDDTVHARGGFTQHGLAVPLSPLKWLLTALGLDGVNRFLPDRLPLTDVHVYDDVTGLDADALLDLVMTGLRQVTGIELPDEDVLREALHQIAGRAAMLPDRLKPYLDLHIPEELSFDLTVSAEGGVLGGVSVAAPGDPAPSRSTATPLRVLLPGLSAAGPMLTGVELWNLRIGEILGGTALLVTADLNIDQFDLLPLAALLALPADVTAGLPDPRHLARNLIAENVTILVVPEALLAVPVFFDDLGVEYRGLEGAEFGGHLSFPQPRLDLAAARDLYQQFHAFLTERGATLRAADFSGDGLDLRFTAGPVFLQLPDYAGGSLLGSRTATTSISAAESLASLLNGLKGLDLAGLLTSLPAELRAAPPAPQPHVQVGPLGFTAGWDLGAAGGLTAGVRGDAHLGPFAHLATTLGVRAGGVTFTSDGGVDNLIDLHLSGSAGVVPAPAKLLQFADPAARVTTPGPAGRPQHFTVEWWTRPTALRDYNQFVSAADVWGSFVFHTTATGAVYCGTDVNTRLTPDQLPAGTVQPDTWQHFAFTYAEGVGSLYRDGVLLARKSNLTPPAPWTGMRLGIPIDGTQPDGFVADLRVWEVCRSAADINATMRHRLTGAEPGLIGWWPLDDAAGATVRDHGPSGFHGAATHTGWAVQAPPPSATAGAELSLLGRTVFTGDLTLAADHAALAGTLDLFPPSSGLTVRGSLAGEVDAQRLTLDGDAAVDLAGFTLAAATIDWTDTRLTLDGTWFGLFGAVLTLDTTKGHAALTGTVSGSRSLDIPFAAVFAHPIGGTVKLADSYHHAGTYGFSFTVTADEQSGLWAQGHVSCDSFSVPLAFAAGPATVAGLDQMIISAMQGVSATFFKQLYADGAAWAQGVASGVIGWARDQVAATGKALQQGYNKAAYEVAQILDAAKFGEGEIGQVLVTTFPDFAVDPGGVAVTTLQQAGFDVVKVGHVLTGAFTNVVSRANRDATVESLTALMWPHYPALEMVKVGVDAGITAESGASILKRVGRYGSQDLADAAHIGFNLSRDDTVKTLDAIGVSAADIVTTVSRSFNSAARDVAKYLYDAGYATLAELNVILAGLGLPPL